MNDDLRELLKAWQVTSPEPAAFRRTVWRRIEAAQARGASGGLWRRLYAALARPSLALPAMAVAVVLGLWIGTNAAGGGEAHYLRWADPYARVAGGHP